jgi:hypothetical protein
MKINILKLSLCLTVIASIFVSCKDDDETTTTFEVRDRTEQQVLDKDSILLYLTTHYYNSGFFETGENHKYSDIIITELPIDEDTGEYLEMPDPADNTLLINAVETLTTTFEEADYEYYILRLNQGSGSSPSFADEIRVKYEGSSVINGNVFDSRITPLDITLVGNGFSSFGTIRAWQLVMPEFNSGMFVGTDNGIVNYDDFGLGVMFVPSGLAYFGGSNTGILYDNLIFKFELLQMEELDHDNDGVPSYIEDLNGNSELSDDDTDEDLFPNYVDTDDDGDGIATINEDLNNDGDPTNDIGANGIPNYLDPEETTSNETTD